MKFSTILLFNPENIICGNGRQLSSSKKKRSTAVSRSIYDHKLEIKPKS